MGTENVMKDGNCLMDLEIDATDRDMIGRGDRIGAGLARKLLQFYDDHSSLQDRVTELETENERLRNAATRVLEWVYPIAGDNRDDESAHEEEESVADLQALLARP